MNLVFIIFCFRSMPHCLHAVDDAVLLVHVGVCTLLPIWPFPSENSNPLKNKSVFRWFVLCHDYLLPQRSWFQMFQLPVAIQYVVALSWHHHLLDRKPWVTCHHAAHIYIYHCYLILKQKYRQSVWNCFHKKEGRRVLQGRPSGIDSARSVSPWRHVTLTAN